MKTSNEKKSSFFISLVLAYFIMMSQTNFVYVFAYNKKTNKIQNLEKKEDQLTKLKKKEKDLIKQIKAAKNQSAKKKLKQKLEKKLALIQQQIQILTNTINTNNIITTTDSVLIDPSLPPQQEGLNLPVPQDTAPVQTLAPDTELILPPKLPPPPELSPLGTTISPPPADDTVTGIDATTTMKSSTITSSTTPFPYDDIVSFNSIFCTDNEVCKNELIAICFDLVGSGNGNICRYELASFDNSTVEIIELPTPNCSPVSTIEGLVLDNSCSAHTSSICGTDNKCHVVQCNGSGKTECGPNGCCHNNDVCCLGPPETPDAVSCCPFNIGCCVTQLGVCANDPTCSIMPPANGANTSADSNEDFSTKAKDDSSSSSSSGGGTQMEVLDNCCTVVKGETNLCAGGYCKKDGKLGLCLPQGNTCECAVGEGDCGNGILDYDEECDYSVIPQISCFTPPRSLPCTKECICTCSVIDDSNFNDCCNLTDYTSPDIHPCCIYNPTLPGCPPPIPEPTPKTE